MTARVVAAVFAGDRLEAFTPTVAALATRHPDIPIVVGSPKAEAAAEALAGWPGVTAIEAWSLGATVRAAALVHETNILAVSAPVLVPPGLLDSALPAVDDDLRIASVSFLSNAASFLSVPHRNREVGHPTGQHDEVTLTHRLREADPAGRLTVVPVAAGSAVFLSWTALSVVGELDEQGAPAAVLAEWSLRCQQRGFVAMLDPSTYVLRPIDLAPLDGDPLQHDGGVRQNLNTRYPWFPSGFDDASTSRVSPLALALQTATVKAYGLRVFVDGTCLGPQQMGTQVQTLAVIQALCNSDDVRSVGVSLPGPVPSYAAEVLSHRKLDATVSGESHFGPLGYADIVHRPFQPDRDLPFDIWAECSHRTLVTIQDLIAYQIGNYHPGGAEWLLYRDRLRRAVGEADGVIVISEDTRDQLAVESLPVDPSRVFRVENGTDHLRGDEPEEVPGELVARGFVAGEFILVLGANYSHKNRDLALQAWHELSIRRMKQSLVLVGAQVPHGSSRRLEAARRIVFDDDVFALPDVNDRERNWLLRHASLVLYTTSAEGFGLVPFEAARFGTPTVAVAFGPLREVNPDVPVSAASWTPAALADAAEQLLLDPALARAQVEATLAAGLRYTWSKTAEGLVSAYRAVLAQPSRRLG